MTRVYLTKRIAGPSGNWGPGSTIYVDDAEARRLVEAGAAELVDAMPEYRPATEAGAKSAKGGKGPKRETATEAGAEHRETATEK